MLVIITGPLTCVIFNFGVKNVKIVGLELHTFHHNTMIGLGLVLGLSFWTVFHVILPPK